MNSNGPDMGISIVEKRNQFLSFVFLWRVAAGSNHNRIWVFRKSIAPYLLAITSANDEGEWRPSSHAERTIFAMIGTSVC